MSNVYVGYRVDDFPADNVAIDLLYRADAPMLSTHVQVPEGVDARDANWLVVTAPHRGASHAVVANDPVRLAAARQERWDEVRVRRDALLQRSDWTQVADAPLATDAVAAWRSYRQALRDLPDQGDPFWLVWPQQP